MSAHADPGHGAPQHGLLPQPDHQGRGSVDPGGAAARRGQDAARILDLPPEGRAPDVLLERTVTYNRLINSPMSVVGHDDLPLLPPNPGGPAAHGNEWVNLQRNLIRRKRARAGTHRQRHERHLDAQPGSAPGASS